MIEFRISDAAQVFFWQSICLWIIRPYYSIVIFWELIQWYIFKDKLIVQVLGFGQPIYSAPVSTDVVRTLAVSTSFVLFAVNQLQNYRVQNSECHLRSSIIHSICHCVYFVLKCEQYSYYVNHKISVWFFTLQYMLKIRSYCSCNCYFKYVCHGFGRKN